MEKDLLFGICADIHHSQRFDAAEGVKNFVMEATERNADFIIQLGDFTLPDQNGQRILDEWNRFNGPRYHVLGNHDTEHGGKETMLQFLGQKESHYSFDCGDYHFIVLDTNFFKNGNEYIDYGDSNYQKDFFNCYIPPMQLEWLAADIDSTDKRCFIFTHATLALGDWTIYNIHSFQNVLWKANEKAGYNKVTMCFSGHDHADEYLFKGGIHYMIVNSMTHKYIGRQYTEHSSNVEKQIRDYGELNHYIPYKQPLYAFVRLRKNGLIQIIGKQSEYVGCSPKELHWEHYASPQIAYREVWMNGIGEL